MNETIFGDSVFFDSLIIIDPCVYIYPQYIPSELNQHSVDSYDDVPMIDG